MAHITLNQYLQQVSRVSTAGQSEALSLSQSLTVCVLQVLEALESRDGSFCAEMLSFKHPHVANPRLQVTHSLTHLNRVKPHSF